MIPNQAIPVRQFHHEDVDFDVVVCGAGLAGLTLARQLRLDQPQLSVALLDPNLARLPQAAWKVGETVEFGAHYLADHLGLEEYLHRAHLVMLGLRFSFLEAPCLTDLRWACPKWRRSPPIRSTEAYWKVIYAICCEATG